jgi:PEP-CTERM motif-containing protein
VTNFRVALVALTLCGPGMASAALLRVDFTTTTTMSQFGGAITPGYQAGVVGTGYFTFDDSLRQVPAVAEGVAALDLSVSWLGQTWDESTARIGYLNWFLDGSLRGFVIGGWYPGDCGVGCVPTGVSNPSDFWVGTDNGVFSSYIHLQNLAGGIYASTTWSVQSIPEPGTLALMAVGLLGAGLVGRRRRHSI